MNERVMAVISANGGLITHAQALDAGLSPLNVRAHIRHGDLVVVKRGVYTLCAVWDELDEYRGRQRLRTRAAIKLMKRSFVVSHDSAAYEHGLEILQPPDPHVHITRPGFTGAWTKAGVKHHLAAYTREQVVEVDDLKVLDLARTAVDIAREHGPPYGEVACDSAMRHGVPRSALMDACVPMRNWKFVRRTRRAVDFADPRAESVVETLARMLVTALGIGDVDPQFPVQLEHGRVLWGDLRVGCHLFEADGKIKYVPTSKGGLADEPAHEVVWAEKKRERDLGQEGLGISRIIFQDYWPPHREAALKRLRAEYDATVARFGHELPERLARNAWEIRRRRGA